MFTDDIGKYRKDSNRVRLSSEIGAYRRPPYGLTRCTDDIAPCRKTKRCTDDFAPFQGQSLSLFARVSIFSAPVGFTALVTLFLFFA